jgi:biotin-dependent carboxylase-like uncharacterized protein
MAGARQRSLASAAGGPDMKATLSVIEPGLFSTIQDRGRFGYQRFGVPVSGALDPLSMRAANLLVGNPPQAATLEILHHGPHVRVEAESARLAYAGAPVRIAVEGAMRRTFSPGQSFLLQSGEELRIGAVSAGNAGYLAVEGGFDVALCLGSRSTYTRARLGGINGRRLEAGDHLPLCEQRASVRSERRWLDCGIAAPRVLRVVLGPQDDYFTSPAIDAFLSASFIVSRASDRMGIRLEGPALKHAKGFDIVSDGTAPGAIQVPGDGQPIVLLVDRQTTGGYPKIATVVSADLAALGRLAPGASISFTTVTLADAAALRKEYDREVAHLIDRVVAIDAATNLDSARLLGANLVSGVIDAQQE